MAAVVVSDLAVAVKFEAYEESPASDEPWCHIITATITNPTTNTQAAHGTAYLIDRFAMSENDTDEEEIFELSQTTEDLFHDDIFWNDVCSEVFVVFHEVIVEPEYRRKGLGKKLVTAIQDKVREHLGGPTYTLAAPGYLGAELDREIMREGARADQGKMLTIQGRQLDTAMAFWKACDFKKVGNSKFRVHRPYFP